MMNIQFLLSLVCTNTDFDLILIGPGRKRTQYPVPKREYDAIIAVPLFDDYRVMNAVHGWRDKEYPEKGFKPFGNFQGTVMELGRKHTNAVEDHQNQQVGAEEKNQ